MTGRKKPFDADRAMAAIFDGPGDALPPMDAQARARALDRLVAQSFEAAPETPCQTRWSRRTIPIAVAVVSAAAAVAVVALRLLPSPEVAPGPVLPSARGAGTAPRPVHRAAPEMRLVADHRPVSAVVGEGVTLLLDPQTRARIADDTAAGLTIRLDQGAIWVDVDPERSARDRRVSVETGRGAMTVAGTVFRVSEGPDATEVTVLEGVVQVTQAASAPRRVVAGQTMRLGGAAPVLVPQAAARAAWIALRDQGVARERATSALEERAAPPGGVRRPGALSSASPTRRSSAPELLRQARAEQNEQDYRAADQTLATLIRRFPESAEASVALVVKGRLGLEKLGRPVDALAHFDAYLDRQAHDTLSAEALFGKARAERALGDLSAACRTLERFVATYRSGPLARAAEAQRRAHCGE